MANQPLDLPSKKPSTKQKPHVSADDLRQFDPDYWATKANDPSWIDGYSQTVQANDIESADDLDFQVAMRESGSAVRSKEGVYSLIGAKPARLKYKLAWLPIAGANGGRLDAGSAKMLRDYTEKQGYRPLSARVEDNRIVCDILDEMGWKLSIDCRVAEDGTIRRGAGDIALYYTDGEVARKWERYAARIAAEADKKELPEVLAEGRYRVETFEDEDKRSVDRFAD